MLSKTITISLALSVLESLKVPGESYEEINLFYNSLNINAILGVESGGLAGPGLFKTSIVVF